MARDNDYTIQVIADADEVLGALSSSKDPMTLADLVTATGLVKNKVFRILRTLEGLRYVEVFGDHYKLGMQLALYWARCQSRLQHERDLIDKNLEKLEGPVNG